MAGLLIDDELAGRLLEGIGGDDEGFVGSGGGGGGLFSSSIGREDVEEEVSPSPGMVDENITSNSDEVDADLDSERVARLLSAFTHTYSHTCITPSTTVWITHTAHS